METEYLLQTKSNIEEKMKEDFDTSDCETDNDLPPTNFIINNFKAAQNTFNVILAQRENDLQRITQLSIKNEQKRSEIKRLDAQKYQFCLDNANLNIEIETLKKINLKNCEDAKKTQTLLSANLNNTNMVAIISLVFNCIMVWYRFL